MKNILIENSINQVEGFSEKSLSLSGRLQSIVKQHCCSKCEQESVHLTHESFYVATDLSCRIHHKLREIN